MRATIERLRRLSRLEWRLLLTACAGLPVLMALSRLAGPSRTVAWLTPATPARNHDARPDALAGVERITRWVFRHHPLKPTCLDRSIALWWLAGLADVAAAIHIGVRRAGDAIEAHAWVEVEGEAIGEERGAPGERFAPLVALPRPRAGA